jgi:hypothetical protein
LWSEQQEVTLDAAGKYSVVLGAVTGLPQELFSGGQARWLGVTLEGNPEGRQEQARTVLVATPYSLKASDAETIGGHPASDFKLVAKDANGKPDTATDISQLTDTGGITFTNSGTGPTVGVGLDLTYLSQQAALCCALLTANNTFTGNQTIKGNLTVTGTGVVTNILPGGAVDITKSGSVYTIALDAAQGQAFGNTYWAQLATANLFKGTQTLAPLGTATSSTAYNSNALQMTGSAYNSSASAAEAINFVWQAEPANSDTGSPIGGLTLLYSTGTNAPTETGLKLGAAGKITFASGQTFPGAGTITGITTTSPLSGSGTSGSVALSLNTSSLETTLNTVYPQLGAANTFTGNQTVDGTEAVTGSSTAAPGQLAVTNTGANGTAIYADSSTGTGIAVVGLNGVNAVANTAQGAALKGTGLDGTVVVNGTTYGGTGLSASGYFGVYATSAEFPGYFVSTSTTNDGDGIYAAGGAASGTGVYASGALAVDAVSDVSTNDGTAIVATGGSAGTGTGISASGYYGVIATGTAVGVSASAPAFGVYGMSVGGVGTVGVGSTYGMGAVSDGSVLPSWGFQGAVGDSISTEGSSYSADSSAGVWGDFINGEGDGSGLLGSADTASAIIGVNNSGSPTMFLNNYTTATHNPIFETNSPNTYSGARHCTIDTSANLACTGQLSGSNLAAVVPVEGGKQSAMYSVQSPENWFEDFGSGSLQSGATHVELEPAFAQTVNTGVEYHVFLTPNGDCKGLYVANKTASGFEVRELGGGQSSVAFDYRIVVKRKGYETVRMEDMTDILIGQRERAAHEAEMHPQGRVNPHAHAVPDAAHRPHATVAAKPSPPAFARPGLRPVQPGGGTMPAPKAVNPTAATRAGLELPKQ